MIGQTLVRQTAIAVFVLMTVAQARAEMLEFDCSDKSGIYYNIWADTSRSTVSIHYARPDLPQDLRTYQAEITPNSIRWAFTGSAQVHLNASIDLATGKYVQVYGGVAQGSGTFQCRRGSMPFPGL